MAAIDGLQQSFGTEAGWRDSVQYAIYCSRGEKVGQLLREEFVSSK